MLAEISRPGVPGMVNFDAAKHEITGYNPDRTDRNLGPLVLPNFKGYFVVEFRKAWKNAATYGLDNYGAKVARGAYAEFAAGEVVEVRVGTSFLSSSRHARTCVRRSLRGTSMLSVTNFVPRGTKSLTACTSTVQATTRRRSSTPRSTTRCSTRASSPSMATTTQPSTTRFTTASRYTAYSIWDTFRAENSMIALMAPERVPGMITALLQNFKEGGWMPKWPNPSYTNIMIGTHADSLVAEALGQRLQRLRQARRHGTPSTRMR